MPSFNTGDANWDQGLGQLSSMLFPDVSKIAQAGLYGAEARKAQLEGDTLQRKQQALSSIPGIIQNLFKPKTSDLGQMGAPTALSAALPVLGQGMGQGAGQGLAEAVMSGIQPGGLGAGTPPPMSSPSPNAGAPAATPTATGTSGDVVPTDPMSAALHPASVMLPGGGGVIWGPPAASNGSPAKAFDLSPLTAAISAAGPDIDQAKIQALYGSVIWQLEQNGQLAKPLGDQLLLNLNPGEIGATTRQAMILGRQMIPVINTQTGVPTEIEQDQYQRDGGRTYRAIGTASETAFNAPQRFYDPNNPLSTITKPAFQGINDRNVQVTDKFAAEVPGGVASRGGPTPGQYETIVESTNIQPPPTLTPEQQNQNAQLVDRVVQRLNPPTSNKTDVNAPILLDDPDGALATLTDDIQRTNPRFRYNREGAATEAYQQLQQQGRIIPPNRATTVIGRNVSGYLTGQVGANPDVVMVDVKNKNGQTVKEPRLRLRILPEGQRQQGSPGAGVLAPPPGTGPVSTAAPPQSAASVFAPRPQAGPVPVSPTALGGTAPPGTWRPGESGWNPPRLANPPPPPPRPQPTIPPGGGMMRPSDIAKARGQAAAPRGVPVSGAASPGSTSSVAAPAQGAQGGRDGDIHIVQGKYFAVHNGQLVPATPGEVQTYLIALQQQGRR